MLHRVNAVQQFPAWLRQPERLAVFPLDVDAGDADVLEHLVVQLQKVATLARAITPGQHHLEQRCSRFKERQARRWQRSRVDCGYDRPHLAPPITVLMERQTKQAGAAS